MIAAPSRTICTPCSRLDSTQPQTLCYTPKKMSQSALHRAYHSRVALYGTGAHTRARRSTARARSRKTSPRLRSSTSQPKCGENHRTSTHRANSVAGDPSVGHTVSEIGASGCTTVIRNLTDRPIQLTGSDDRRDDPLTAGILATHRPLGATHGPRHSLVSTVCTQAGDPDRTIQSNETNVHPKRQIVNDREQAAPRA